MTLFSILLGGIVALIIIDRQYQSMERLQKARAKNDAEPTRRRRT